MYVCRYTNKRTKFKIAGTVQKETPQVFWTKAAVNTLTALIINEIPECIEY